MFALRILVKDAVILMRETLGLTFLLYSTHILSEPGALTEGASVLIVLLEASLSEDVQIVRRRFGQKLDASDAMAFLAESKNAVILPMETLFRVTARTNFPLALDTYSQ